MITSDCPARGGTPATPHHATTTTLPRTFDCWLVSLLCTTEKIFENFENVVNPHPHPVHRSNPEGHWPALGLVLPYLRKAAGSGAGKVLCMVQV